MFSEMGEAQHALAGYAAGADDYLPKPFELTILEAKVLYFDWCDVYNNFRPHSSLGYLAPAMFAALLLGQLPSPELQTR